MSAQPSRIHYPDGKRIELYAAIGVQIRTLREARGCTRAVLAKLIDVVPSTLSSYEGGSCVPVWVLVAIAEELDCTLDDLVPVVT